MGYQSRNGGGPPAWFTFLVGVAFIFGGFYFFRNLQGFLESGRISVSEATAVSLNSATSTAIRQVTVIADLPTSRPTATPRPSCQTFEVSAQSGIMRQAASTSSAFVESLPQGTEVCVLESLVGSDGFVWYFIDRNEITRFIEPAYMREDVIVPVNPTPTVTNTGLPAPTITLTPSLTATNTPVITPMTESLTQTVNPEATNAPTATPTLAPTETPNSVQI